MRADLAKIWKILHGESVPELVNLLERADSVRTRGHSLKLSMPRCRSELGRRMFSARRVFCWNALPAEVVEAGSVDIFKKRLDLHLGDQLYNS